MAKNDLLLEGYKRRFREICEMTILNGDNVYEADKPDADNGQDSMGGMPDMNGDQGQMGSGMPDMGGDQGQMGGMPDMNGDQGQMGGGMPDMNGDQGQMGGAQTPQGFDPQVGGDDSMPMMDDSMDGPSDGDDVVDISQLTDAQEETKEEVEGLNGKFAEIMKHIGAFEELLRSNDEKIENLKSEFEKRNPTQIEKLNLQTTKSYPFNVTPEEYWREKEATSNYSTEPDNNGKEQGQYVITKDDVNGATDWKSISDSLDDDDFIYNQTLKGVMGI